MDYAPENLKGLELYLADGNVNDTGLATIKAIKANEYWRQNKRYKDYADWVAQNRERCHLDALGELERLRNLETRLVANAKSCEQSIKDLTTIKTDHLYRRVGCKSFTQYIKEKCGNGKKFGLSFPQIMALVHHDEVNEVFAKATGMSFRDKNASRVVMPKIEQLDPAEREETMQSVANFAKGQGLKEVSLKVAKDWVSHIGSPEKGITGVGNNYPTPPEIFNPLDELFHFKCDVCADDTDKKCKPYFTIKQDGLKQDWSKFPAVWCNPPYDKSKAWMDKAYQTALAGTVVVTLTPANTEVSWFQRYAPYIDLVFIRDRVEFAPGQKLQWGSLLAIWHLQNFTAWEAYKTVCWGFGLFIPAVTPLYQVAWEQSDLLYPDKDEDAFGKRYGWEPGIGTAYEGLIGAEPSMDTESPLPVVIAEAKEAQAVKGKRERVGDEIRMPSMR